MRYFKFHFKKEDQNSPIRVFRLLCDGQPYFIRFFLLAGEPSLSTGVFRTNYPPEGTKFDRKTFHKYEFQKDTDGNGFVELSLKNAGCFDFNVEYTQGKETKYTKMNHFLLFPEFRLNGELRSFDAIVLQTIIPKWLGPIETWDSYFKVAAETGYNMIHFTPPQRRGNSDSPYSIYDQLTFSDEIFGDKASQLNTEQRDKIFSDYIKKLESQFGMLSLVDVVWNHTSWNSAWLREHPESGYNLVNSPHLKPAFAIDSAIMDFSNDIKNYCGIDAIHTEDDFERVMGVFEKDILPSIKLWEYIAVDVDTNVAEFHKALQEGKGEVRHTRNTNSLSENIFLLRSKGTYFEKGYEYERNKKKVDVDVALSLFFGKIPRNDIEKVDRAAAEFKKILQVLNVDFYKQYDDDLRIIKANIRNTAKYHQLTGASKGRPISARFPLVEPYFARLDLPSKNADPYLYCLANNGWIWNGDPLQDFAHPSSKAYYLREVVIWGDSVKLRYGSSPDDNPWLWDFMGKYTKKMAKMFHGFRIDNCHSTPLHVGQHLLDLAREVNPNLYVVAELFSGSKEKDVLFAATLGLHSMIRECLAPWDSKEFAHILHGAGGTPVGGVSSFLQSQLPSNHPHPKSEKRVVPDKPFYYLLQEYVTHTLLMDCTHDNETPTQKRTTQDSLSSAALSSMSHCAIGSTRGFDELYPTHLNVARSNYRYPTLTKEVGIMPAKKLLQKLHTKLALEGYSETHVHQDGPIICINRVEPSTSKGYLLIANTAFKDQSVKASSVHSIRLNRVHMEVEFLAKIDVPNQSAPIEINGILQGIPCSLNIGKNIEGSVKIITSGDWKDIRLENFPAGSIVIFKTEPDTTAAQSMENILSSLELNSKENLGWYVDAISRHCQTAKDAVAELTINELNILLYRCDAEERDQTGGFHGSYVIPNFGPLSYCGLEGLAAVLKGVIRNNDMGHPIFSNLRDGVWLVDYCVDRLNRYLPAFPALKEVTKFMTTVFSYVKQLPNFLIPRYFTVTVMSVYYNAIEKAISLMSPFIQEGGEFSKALSLGIIQLCGPVKSTSLLPNKEVSGLAAGLPHFATQYMRCWGRDTFIALRGLMMITGRFDLAKRHLLAFGSCLRHGLIPNLLDSGRNPRFNCRDAVWFYIQCVQDYCTMSPEGLSFLNAKIERRFPNDDIPSSSTPLQLFTIKELILEVFQRHANGIHYRELNAGPSLDSEMTDIGFNVDIHVNWENGFIYGGNEYNCGTWMDKMGSSAKAKNKGIPSTSRNGANVEIIGLLKSALKWINSIDFSPSEVQIVTENGVEVKTFKEWEMLLSLNFELYFYVPRNPLDDSRFKIRPEQMNRRGIYKDIVGSVKGWTDYQLRPNFLIAMAVAPELFSVDKARYAIDLVAKYLAGPLGMKTLDPGDLNYRPNYDNADDSFDPSIAKGANYHNGPEWVWLTGYFLRAYLIFKSDGFDDKATVNEILRRLQPHKRMVIRDSLWASLPELTNDNGAYCRDSCDSQAWSLATILDVMFDLHLYSLNSNKK